MIAPLPLTGEVGHISAWLDNTRTDIEKVFRCNACGAPMFKYWDSLRVVIPGAIDTGENPFIVQCHGRFEFITAIGRPISAACKTTYWIYR